MERRAWWGGSQGVSLCSKGGGKAATGVTQCLRLVRGGGGVGSKGVSCAVMTQHKDALRGVSEQVTSFMGYISLLSMLDWPTKLTGRLRSVM